MLLLPLALADSDAWEAMLDRAMPAVVTIHVASTRTFDADGASSSTATGFVVDAVHGFLLTNRHVVHPGPVVAEAIFADHEEVALKAVYRDPIHDFGVYQFDPAAVRYQPVTALELAPEHARVGAEIRVVGSDNAEKIAILGGTIARLDRTAPDYGPKGFNDFNTFYIQAASSTSGGSSGSPVLDIHGHAVALNAGSARTAATSFFLPLERVKAVLAALEAGQPVPRGTWEAVLEHRTYDEVRRLGLPAAKEAELRKEFPDGTGLLVVDEVVPGGPADRAGLRPGDIVLDVAGSPMTGFVPLEILLDEDVGRRVSVRVQRGEATLDREVDVEDLHAVTPSAYLEVGGGVVHPLSFQQARNNGIAVRGLYVASAGYSFENAGIPAGSVIEAVGGTDVATLADLEHALAGLADSSEVTVRWFHVDEPRRHQVSVLRVDRRWFPMQVCTRDDSSGRWPCRVSPAPPAPSAPASVTAPPLAATPGPGRDLARSLVWVQFSIPVRTEGVYAPRFGGTGVIVDAARGWVLVDRDTVPVALGDVRVVFGGTASVPGEVVAVHPFHNLALVRYDPAAIGETPVRAVRLADGEMKPGARVWHVGLAGGGEIVTQSASVTRFAPLTLPLPSPPGFRDTDLEVYDIDHPGRANGGVLAGAWGEVHALWASFVDNSTDKPQEGARGVPADVIERFLAPLRSGEPPVYRSLGAELREMSLVQARQRGLPDDVVAAIAHRDPERRTVLAVERLVAGSPAATLLREGDLVLAANHAPATALADVERAASGPSVALDVFRDGASLALDVPTLAESGAGLDRVVQWAGAVLHETRYDVAAQRGFPATGVYVAWTWFGSPAQRYGVRGTLRVLSVDDQPVADLDALRKATDGRADRSSVRVRVVDLDGKESVLTLKLDLQYWPTVEWVRGDSGWQRKETTEGAFTR